MKKSIVLALAIFGLGNRNVSADLIDKLAVGQAFALSGSYPTMDFLYRQDVAVLGLVISKGSYREYQNNKPLSLRAYDADLIVGHWSNEEKKNYLGWHFYSGFGISWFDVVQSGGFRTDFSSVWNFRTGIGLDYYLLMLADRRSYPNRFPALTCDFALVARNHDPVGRVFGLFQIGWRLWF